MGVSRVGLVAALFALSFGAIAFACSGQVETQNDGPGPTVDAQAAVDAAVLSFDPRAYPTDCAADEDCMIVEAIGGCYTCCSSRTAIRRGQASIDREAVARACASEPTRGFGSCGLGCPDNHPACFEGVCVLCAERTCAGDGIGQASRDGVLVSMSLTFPGAYVFEAVVDGATKRCRHTLDTGQILTFECDPGLWLEFAGAPASRVVTGLRLLTTTAASITVRVTRDGTSLGEKTFAPSYARVPGPNGPGCAPAFCTSASTTFP